MDPNSTPLISRRTLSAAAQLLPSTTSRLPRRLSLSTGESSLNAVPSTVGRISIRSRPSTSNLVSATPGTASRLPILGRRASISQPPAQNLSPRNNSVLTGKRSASAAGFNHESELTTLRKELSTTQFNLSSAAIVHQREVMSLSTSVTSFEAQLKEAITKVDLLQRQRAALLGKEREREEREEKENKNKIQEESEIRKELSILKSDFFHLSEEKKELESRYRGNRQAGKSAQAECERLKLIVGNLELESKNDKIEREEEVRKEREKRLSVEQELDLARREERSGGMELVREELSRQVNHLKSLEKENAKLTREVGTYKIQYTNVEVLKESKRALEIKLRGHDELRTKNSVLESEIHELKQEKLTWSAYLANSTPTETPEFSTPQKLTKSLANSRLTNSTLQESINSIRLELQNRDGLIGELEDRIVELENQILLNKKELSSFNLKGKEMELREGLAKREVEMLKANLATYELESIGNTPMGTSINDGGKLERINQLEELLEAHRKQLVESNKNVDLYRGLVERYGGNTSEIALMEQVGKEEEVVSKSLKETLKKNEELNEQLVELTTENKLLLTELEALEILNDSLTYSHQAGAYDPTKTKVLQLNSNPDLVQHVIRTEKLNNLREENEALLSELGEFVPRESLTRIANELEQAKAFVVQKEILEKRLVKAWTIKADEVRKVVMSLLGYRLDFLASGRVKVTSIYSPTKDLNFLFTSSAGDIGTMALIGGDEGEFKELGDEIKGQSGFWVKGKGSIPAFLATVQLTLFDKIGSGGN